jgi:hypothetical protein
MLLCGMHSWQHNSPHTHHVLAVQLVPLLTVSGIHVSSRYQLLTMPGCRYAVPASTDVCAQAAGVPVDLEAPQGLLLAQHLCLI